MLNASLDKGINGLKSRIIHRLSCAGQEAVPLDQIQQELHADPKDVATALRDLLENRRVNMRRGTLGSGGGAAAGVIDTRTYLSLSTELSESVSMVLSAIRASGNSGIDQAQIASKLRLARTDVLKALQTLLAQKLIQERRSFMNRAKRIYLLFHMEPSDQVTGGTLYCGEELDVAYVDELRQRMVAFVLEKCSVSMDELVRFVEGETTVGGEQQTQPQALSSPIALVHSRPNSSFSSQPPPALPPPAIASKRLTPRDVKVLTQSLVLDGVLDDVRVTPDAAPQYQLANGHNVIRHFTCIRKRARELPVKERAQRTAHAGRAEACGVIHGAWKESGSPSCSCAPTEQLHLLMQAESIWEPACVSRPSAGMVGIPACSGSGSSAARGNVDERGGWAYMPAMGFPCLGCPQLSNCLISGKGLINPIECAYLREWLS